MAQHLDDLVGADPQGRHAILRALRHERALPEARVEIADDLVLETRHGERCVVSHGRLNLDRRAQRGIRAALWTQRFAPRREIGLVDALVADHPRQSTEIGRVSCWERDRQYSTISSVDGTLTNTSQNHEIANNTHSQT